ncbi:6963_t:CDS:2, partial [Racocetra fulgida]
KRATETAKQRQLHQQADANAHYTCTKNQHDAITHLSRQTTNLQLLNFARNFSEVLNTNKHPFPHQIDIESSTNCTHYNVLKLPMKRPGMCCSNSKVVLAESNIPPLLNHLFSTNIPGLDLRTYNTPTASQVAAIWVDDEVLSNVIQKCDIVLHTNMDQLIHISEFNGCYDPLVYPILFPYCEQGWSPHQIPYRGVFLVPDDNNVENSDLDDEINEPFHNETLQSKSSYPKYHRRQNGRQVEVRVGNRA